MANRRMFSKDVTEIDKFYDLPKSPQLLYFHLGMHADDDGFVKSPKGIARSINCSETDLEILADNGYIISFPSGVVVITDWKENNSIRADRYHPTTCENEKAMLIMDGNRYRLKDDTATIESTDNQSETNRQPIDNQLTTKQKPTVTEVHTEVEVKDKVENKNNNRIINNSICTEPETVSVPEPVIISLPLNNGSGFDVTETYLETLRGLYPAVDVDQELRNMYGWLDSNPSKRKTRTGIKRFITNWLSKEQNKGGNRPAARVGSVRKQHADDVLMAVVNGEL